MSKHESRKTGRFCVRAPSLLSPGAGGTEISVRVVGPVSRRNSGMVLSAMRALPAALGRCRIPRSAIALILGGSFLTLAACIIFWYIKMRQVTTTAVRFEGIPCYIIALQLVICAVIVILLSRPRFNQETTALRFAGAIFGVSLCLCVIGIVMLFWLAEKHDTLAFCIFDPERKTCACRADNRTKSSTGWHLYEDVDSCRALDSLFRMMIATMIVYAVAAFCCALALMFVYSTALSGRSLPSQPATEGAGYADWDSWLRSTDNLQRIMTAMRNGWFPPSYDTSQRQTRRELRRLRDRQRIFSVTAEAPPPYSPSSATPNSPSVDSLTTADAKPRTSNVTTIELS